MNKKPGKEWSLQLTKNITSKDGKHKVTLIFRGLSMTNYADQNLFSLAHHFKYVHAIREVLGIALIIIKSGHSLKYCLWNCRELILAGNNYGRLGGFALF